MTDSNRLPVVYLAGSGHTGSTLLALFLDAHPRIVSVGETAFKRRIQRRNGTLACTCGVAVHECPFWQRIFGEVTASGFEFNAHQWSNDYRYKNRFAHRLLSRNSAHPMVRLIQRTASLMLPWHRARMARISRVNIEFIRTVLRVAGADVFFDTSKRAVRLSHLLDTPELDVRIVKLVRDVRGYAASAKKRGQSVSDAASAWRHARETFEQMTRALPADRTMLVRYEDVCGDPRTWLKRMYAFCGVQPIDPPDVVTPREHHVLGNSMRLSDTIRIRLDERWRVALTAEEQACALAIAGPMHAKFGYAAQ